MPRKDPQDHRRPMEASFTVEPVAVARTPYGERFGVPNQAASVRGTREGAPAIGRIELLPHVPDGVLEGLEGFERAWVIFVFHLNHGWGPKVRPPRAPHRSLGVFATRAPHRPSRLGLSALAIEAVEPRALVVRGIDLVDGTPVLDIKPYVPYADAFPGARGGWVDETIPSLEAERSDPTGWREP